MIQTGIRERARQEGRSVGVVVQQMDVLVGLEPHHGEGGRRRHEAHKTIREWLFDVKHVNYLVDNVAINIKYLQGNKAREYKANVSVRIASVLTQCS